MKTRLIPLILIAGLLAACATPATEAPASPPTEELATPTETNPPPTDTVVPPTDTAIPTNTATPTLEPTSAATTETTTAPAASATVSFANDIFPLLKSRCGNCHGGNKIEEGLNMLTYADLITGSDNGPVVIPGNAAKSLLVEMVSSQKMPKKGPKLTPPQVQLIVDWVNQGALDN